MEKGEDIKNIFKSDLDYILTNLEKDILRANILEDKLYFEMTKGEIKDALNYIYKSVKNWKSNFNSQKHENIINNYREIESIVSQLELCLADFKEEFNMDGISYSIFEIGKILSDISERNDKNGR